MQLAFGNWRRSLLADCGACPKERWLSDQAYQGSKVHLAPRAVTHVIWPGSELVSMRYGLCRQGRCHAWRPKHMHVRAETIECAWTVISCGQWTCTSTRLAYGRVRVCPRWTHTTDEIDMHVFTLAGPKGGCGKSTLAAALAVRATHETGKVAIIDLNEDQGTIQEWWVQRGRPVNPFLYDGEGTLDSMIEGLRADNWSYAFVDDPPYEQDLIEMSVLVANTVLIPVKLAYFDTAAIDSVVGMCQRRRKPYSFVVNEYDDRKMFENANNLALAMLAGRGPVLKQRISYHPKHRLGQIEGRTGAEIDKGLAREIDALWGEVKQLAGITVTLRSVEVGRG